MTMTETPTETPKPKRKYVRRKKAVAAPKPPSELAGLTITDCPNACNVERCVISGRPVCAHPRKGGLQPAHMNDESTARIEKAQKMLGKKTLDIRGMRKSEKN